MSHHPTLHVTDKDGTAFVVTTHFGAGDQIVVVAESTKDQSQAVFTGSLHGSPGPIHVRTSAFETFVAEARRFGPTFDASWVARYLRDDRIPDGMFVTQETFEFSETLVVSQP